MGVIFANLAYMKIEDGPIDSLEKYYAVSESVSKRRKKAPDIHGVFFAFGANCEGKRGKSRERKRWRGWGKHRGQVREGPKENGRGTGEIRRETMYLVSTFQVGLHRLVTIAYISIRPPQNSTLTMR